MADSPLGLGQLAGGAIGAADLAMVLGRGESSLPSEFGTVAGSWAPAQFQQGQTEFGAGYTLANKGTQALTMAQRGQLTAPQQAALGETRNALSNQAAQMYYSMGRSPTRDTSFLGTTADIDAKVNAMAQQFIQTTIQLGGAELSAGASFMTAGSSAESAATNALLAAGSAQMKLDEDYSNAIQAAFGAMAKGFGGGGTNINLGGGGGGGASPIGWSPPIAG